MEITEVRLFPTESRDGKLKAFATMTFDDWFVVRNVKIIQGNNGLFVAMPSRKAMDSCKKCHFKNVVGSKYCNQCGTQVEQQPQHTDRDGADHGGHMDIAHPITQECRVYIQEKILEAYNKDGGAQPKERTEKKEVPQEVPEAAKVESVEPSEPQETPEIAPVEDKVEEKDKASNEGMGAGEIDPSKDIEL